MKKICLLLFCFIGTHALLACKSVSDESYDEAVFFEDSAPQSIDATTNSGDRCGVDGISCNDTPLVNYTKTEADFRAYGERTKRDALYTQSSAGNNLTASIRPSIEEEIVVAQNNTPYSDDDFIDDGVFSRTNGLDMASDGSNIGNGTNTGNSSSSDGNGDNIGLAHKFQNEDGSSYEIVCTEGCEDMMDDDDIITSEFTEESFDIADYVKDIEDADVHFINVGDVDDSTSISLTETKITDDTILTWEAEEGSNLRELLTKWSSMAGWKLLWNTNRNYILSAGVTFKGKFADVSSALIRAFARARPAPVATYYKGNRVIVVETMENENAY